ncbi:MAG: hypothetical protein KY476_26740, partial [Planctomycetes bacterium]|nr:hypothetical protein [Planctomycetota bacterium]
PHVSHVVEGSPADHAGIREGDFVLGYGGHRYCSAKQFAGALGDGAHNGHMNVHVWRNGNSFFANVEPQPYDLVYADDLEGRGELDQQFAGRGRRARDMNRREAARPDLNLLNQVDQMQAEIDTLKAELRTLQRQMRDMRAARGAGDADARDFNERDPNGTLDDGRGLDAVPPLRNDRIDPLSPRDRTDGIDRGATTPELDDRGVNDRSLRRPGTADDIAPPEPPAGDRGTDAGIRGRGAAAESGDSSIGVPATNETPGAIDSPSDRGGASDATDTGAGTSGTGGTGAGGTGGTGN